MVSIPRPKKADRPNLKRRAEKKKAIALFQASGETHWCTIGHYAEQTCWHHKQGRYADTLLDENSCIRICKLHHSEGHQIGPERFFKKYGILFA